MRVKEDFTLFFVSAITKKRHHHHQPVDLDIERGISLEEGGKLVIIVMNTDDMLIAYTKNAKSFVDDFERILNESFEATPREKVEYYMGMHIVGTEREGTLVLMRDAMFLTSFGTWVGIWNPPR